MSSGAISTSGRGGGGRDKDLGRVVKKIMDPPICRGVKEIRQPLMGRGIKLNLLVAKNCIIIP